LQSKSPTSNTLTMPLQSSQIAQSITSTQSTNLNNLLQSISLTKKKKADTTTSDLFMTSTSNKFSKQSPMSFPQVIVDSSPSTVQHDENLVLPPVDLRTLSKILSVRQKSFTQIEHITRRQAKLEYLITEQ
ncbi:22391_t:CDS:2, partial [Racocetra persica]